MIPEKVEFRQDSTFISIVEKKDKYLLEATVLRHYCGPELGHNRSKAGIKVRERYETHQEALERAEELADITKTYMKARQRRSKRASELDKRAREIRKQDAQAANTYIEEVLGE